MAPIRRLVLDLLKPHDPETIEFATEIADLDGVSGTNATLLETDKDVQNIKITVEGEDVSFDRVEDTIEGLGGTVHSVDEVVCGEMLVEESPTPQD